MGVRRIPIPEIQAMIACKNCVWLVGWFAVGQIYGLSVVGFIASRSDGWFVCYRSFGRIYGRWLACRLVCLLSGLSVGWTIRPTCYQPITDWPTIHPYIWSLTNRPKTVLLSVLASDQCLNFSVSGVRRLPVLVQLVGCGGATDPCLQVSGQVWGVFHLASQGGIPSSIAYPQIDLGTLNKGCVTCFAMPCISTYIFSCCIQLPVLPIPPTCNGLKSIFGDTPIGSANTPWIGILEKALFGDSNHEFL